MKRVVASSVILAVSSLWSLSPSFSAEKFRVGTAVRGNPPFFVFLMATQEKGFWKAQGLEGEWVPFNATVAMAQAAVAGAIDTGVQRLSGLVLIASRKIPVIAVSNLAEPIPWYLWVKADSVIREPKELKGAKIAVTRIGDITHANALATVRALGLEKETKIVATGGVPHMIAALKAGVADGVALSVITMASLEYQGEARKLVDLTQYTGQRWDYLILYARKELVQKKPELTKTGLRALFQGARFANDNPAWAVEKIKSEMRWPEPVARRVYELSRYSRDGTMDVASFEGMRKFMSDYRLLAEGTPPALDDLVTTRFTPVQ